MPRNISSRPPSSWLIAEREITQTQAARLVDMKQPDLSKLLRGQFKLVSVEKLMQMLTAFDRDVEITVKPHRKRGETAGSRSFRPKGTERAHDIQSDHGRNRA